MSTCERGYVSRRESAFRDNGWTYGRNWGSQPKTNTPEKDTPHTNKQSTWWQDTLVRQNRSEGKQDASHCLTANHQLCYFYSWHSWRQENSLIDSELVTFHWSILMTNETEYVIFACFCAVYQGKSQSQNCWLRYEHT